MNEQVVKRLAVLLSVKSLVTLALTAVFAALTISAQLSSSTPSIRDIKSRHSIFEIER